MAPPGRTLVGTRSGVSSRLKIYLTPDAVEIEEVEGYDISRRRVFFDDILLVTYHQFFGWAFILGMGLLSAFFGLMTVAVALGDRKAGLVMFAIAVLPFLALIGLRLALRVDAVTVYGKRTRAQIRFWLRKRRAREVYQQICRLAREHQAS